MELEWREDQSGMETGCVDVRNEEDRDGGREGGREEGRKGYPNMDQKDMVSLSDG